MHEELRPYRRWLRRFERPTAFESSELGYGWLISEPPRTPSPLIDMQPGPVTRRRHRGRSPGGPGGGYAPRGGAP